MQSSLQIANQLGLLSLQRMKQTNNAIKFLMAQYRAIFKNANIAMVAAMVAAALAAGQANAADLAQKDWAGLAGDKTAGSGGDFDAVKITASGESVEVNDNEFTLTWQWANDFVIIVEYEEILMI